MKSTNAKRGNGTLAVISLSSIPLVMTLGNSMLIPVLPTMEKKMSISSFQSSLIITIYSIFAIFCIPIAGYLSDRIGRRKVIIPSLILAGAGGIVCGFAAGMGEKAYMFIMIGRALQGIGAAGAAPIVLPLVGDLFGDDEKKVSSSLGKIETANTFGKVLSPILGAFLAGLFWYLPFYAIPVLSALSILLILFFVKAPKTKQKPMPFGEFIHSLKAVFKKDGRWLYAIFAIGGIVMLVLFGVLFYLSNTLEKEQAVTGVKKGLFLAIPLVSLCLASYVTGEKIEKNKVLMKWIIVIGLAVLSVTLCSAAFIKNIWGLLAIMFVSGIGIGACLPALDALITEGTEQEERGTITSLYSSMRFIGVAAGPPLFSVLMDKSAQWLFFTAALICVPALLCSFFAIDPKKKRKLQHV
ncbi:ACDE family multidrug resistance protein [Bacillus fengqiuensis]|nr:ACDE family multidrug resistance protein [Bacillus fengqiuensis]